jgi:hypothetical protein
VASRAYSSTLKMEAICSSETSVDVNGLHGVISQKIVLFITTAVRTSHSTITYIFAKSFSNDEFVFACNFRLDFSQKEISIF